MIIKSVTFAGAIASPGATPPGHLPQIAFSGRSNVGKSSLINRLLGRTRTQVARVSATPGKTREINFFDVAAGLDGRDVHFFLVDLPGYGFARVPEEIRASWARTIEWYLSETAALRGVVHIVDARHDPTAHDERMVAYLAELGLPTLVVLNKMDKLKRSERVRAIGRISERLEIDESQTLPFSARTGEGRDELLAAIETLTEGEAAERSEEGGPPPEGDPSTPDAT